MAKQKRTAAQRTADQRRTGRPPKTPEERRARPVMVYLTEAEYDLLAVEAECEGITVASLIMRPWREGA
jgi:hypothetical protein